MNPYLLLVPILLPIIGGACLPAFRFKEGKHRQIYVSIIVILNSMIIFGLLYIGMDGTCMPLKMAEVLEIKFRMDGLSKVFAGLVATLWPIAIFYAFEYMAHEQRKDLFFTFYTITYGVTVGIAFAANFTTLYMFYELLTLSTLTLVMHQLDKKSVLAGRKYVVYSIAGAAFVFIGFMFILYYGDTVDFIYGGVLNSARIGDRRGLLLLIFVFTVLGFGVKAAVFPFHKWLPTASVAPTPVTALLHAVAVVKAGAFAIMRMTYYSFGADFVRGSWAQYLLLTFTIVTIIYGSAMALKEQHLKRRLAYSTISNLSYIVFGTLLMTPSGFVGGMAHMIMHAVMKITLFFCVGAIMHQTHKEYIWEIRGIARYMPVVMACFTVGSVALMGVPLLCGFVSKWYLGVAAVQAGNGFAYAGLGALLISALLTAYYLMSIVNRAYFDQPDGSITTSKDPGWGMKAPLIILCIGMLVLGVYSGPLIRYLEQVASGLL